MTSAIAIEKNAVASAPKSISACLNTSQVVSLLCSNATIASWASVNHIATNVRKRIVSRVSLYACIQDIQAYGEELHLNETIRQSNARRPSRRRYARL